jgi:hypothetical protein
MLSSTSSPCWYSVKLAYRQGVVTGDEEDVEDGGGGQVARQQAARVGQHRLQQGMPNYTGGQTFGKLLAILELFDDSYVSHPFMYTYLYHGSFGFPI